MMKLAVLAAAAGSAAAFAPTNSGGRFTVFNVIIYPLMDLFSQELI